MIERRYPVLFRSCGACGAPIELRLTERGYQAYDHGVARHLCRRRKDTPGQKLLPFRRGSRVG